MKSIARSFYKMTSNILFFVGLPLFYFLFVLVYDPFHMEEFLAVGKDQYTLNLLICTLIVLGVITVSRMLLFILRGIIDMNWPLYTLWCIGEMVACGLFMSIPLGIGWAGEYTYFHTMSRCVLYTAGILVFPMALNSFGVQLYVLGKRAERAPVVDERTLVRFYDEQKRLKLVVSSTAILYIEAEENYVHIVHMDAGRVKNFELRSSMRALEETLSRHGLVRCHRSYFINPAHVDLLKKDANGYALAQLDREGMKSIPVSKRYYEAVTALL